jgi:hypothetical protein
MEMKPCSCDVQTKQFFFTENMAIFFPMSLVRISRTVVEESSIINDFNI